MENTPTSPTKRLGVSLNVDTGYKGKGNGKEISPPETPKRERSRATRGNIAVANRALRVQTRETFLDDITPIDPSYNRNHDLDQAPRDSHDLSLSQGQVTRDSLVDHMLLSLDQLSFGQDNDAFGRQPTVDEEKLYQTSFGDEDSYLPNQNFAPRNGRGNGHNFSYSSDYDNAADDASRYSGGQLQSRRSNSSSNFQTSLGRASSKRKDSNPFGGSRGTPPHIPPRGIHSRSGKGSKGSSANSFDLGYAQVQGSQRGAHGLAGRSSSFDYGSDRHAMNMPSSPISRQMESNMAFDPYDYDAAPTPTVPGGPRRPRPASPILVSRPEVPLINPVPPKLERKRSTRSSKSGYKGKLSGNYGGRFDLRDRSHDLPPMPAFSKESAPAPLVGYGKSKDPLPSPAPLQAPKEKQGFFRRVFGSSRNNPVATEPPSSHGSTNSAETNDRPNTKPPHIGTQIKPPPAREPPPAPKEHAHVLTKKPSSFFRRRKKSVSEAGPLVPVPAIPAMELPTEEVPVVEKPLPSPVSSLRKIMNPYLRTPAMSPMEPHRPADMSGVDDDFEPDRSARGFSPDYEPDPSATIRTVKHYDRESNLGFSYASAQQSFFASPNSPSGFDGGRDERDVTFLADSSDNDREGPNREPEPRPTSERHVRKVSSHSVHKHTPTQSDLTFESPQSLKSAWSASKATQLAPRNEGWVKGTPTNPQKGAEKDDRVRPEPSSSEEDIVEPKLTLGPKRKASVNRVSGSTDTVYQSATSPPVVQVEGEDVDRGADHVDEELITAAEVITALEAESAVAAAADEFERRDAKMIYEGNEDIVAKEKATPWLAEEEPARVKTLVAYMKLYDFANLNILAALRMLCGRLVLKGESQQVDRILVAFSKRWFESNPQHGFKGVDVVHTVCYSLLLLNTDLHLADIDQKMTRSQFVKNAMPTIRKAVADCVPEAFDEKRPSILPGKSSTFDIDQPKPEALKPILRSSTEIERPSWRSSFKPSPRTIDPDKVLPTPLDYETPVDDCGPLVKSTFHGTMRTWEVQVEIVLKDFYNSIRAERLPLFAGASGEPPRLQAPSTNSLSVFTNGMLRRTPSVLSKTPSEAQSFNRGRTAETMRVGNGKWANKNRSRPRLYPGSGMGSSRTSLDDQSSMWSPSVSSSTWSKYSLGKTHTSMSVDSLGSSYPQGDYQQSIGFANALSQAIIREESIGSPGSIGTDRDEMRVAPLLEDESLELYGAPWAKEGIVKHKHHLESLDKKAKDRNWNEVFAVIEKGYMSLFSFSSKSLRNKSKGKAAGGVVGGGNWQENAQSLGSFLLRQTIASALPSPGYSKARPHVWALSLPTGAVHLFQVGTPDIVKEFVSSANYWSARLSNHPLVGGISNIEYGWSDAIVNNSLVTAINDSTGNSTRPSTSGRTSRQSSLRSSIDQGYPGGRPRLAGDKISISDWTPPTQSMRASNLMEQDQLRTLTDYVSGIEEELQKHNQLRSPMLLAFTPRHPNAQKAMANWEKKSSYLLREIVKFRTYIDCLQAAEVGKMKIYAERDARKAELRWERAPTDEDEADTTLKAES